MPRPKGSKNKTKTVKATVDFAAQIAEKQSAKEAAAAEIASITANIDALKADLKAKKAELKSIDKEIARIEAKKVIRYCPIVFFVNSMFSPTCIQVIAAYRAAWLLRLRSPASLL